MYRLKVEVTANREYDNVTYRVKTKEEAENLVKKIMEEATSMNGQGYYYLNTPDKTVLVRKSELTMMTFKIKEIFEDIQSLEYVKQTLNEQLKEVNRRIKKLQENETKTIEKQ